MSSKLNTVTLKEVLKVLGNAVIKVIGPQDKIINKPASIHGSQNEKNITSL